MCRGVDSGDSLPQECTATRDDRSWLSPIMHRATPTVQANDGFYSVTVKMK